MKLFSETISTLEGALSYSSIKQKVIAQNIANADTPNYKAKDVSFKSALQTAMNVPVKGKRTDVRHISFSHGENSPVITTRQNVSYNHNGNSVDVDKEMADLATNQIYYNAMTDLLNGKLRTLQSVIKGGR